MLKEKITETVLPYSNIDISEWYQGKVTELTKFFVKRVHEDSQFAYSENPEYSAPVFAKAMADKSRNSGMTPVEAATK